MEDAGTQAGQALAARIAVTDSAFIDTGEHTVIAKNRPLLSRCFKQKPLQVVYAEESEGVLERTLGFWDLFALGFGGTVGSGVFVMAGLICHEVAGPAGMLSWLVAGVGCLLSGMSFAELSWRVPSAGGAYAYAFVALGELPAAIVGWCMTLEYGISGAAVARSWGEMLRVGLLHSSADGDDTTEGVDKGQQHAISLFGAVLDMGGVYAALLQGACVLVVVGGLQASKYTVNTFCVAKALLVAFMCATAFSLWNADNFVPLAPFGTSGVLKGGVAAFFGFLGFDEVVLLAPEAKNPSKHVPRALFASLLGVTLVCATASVALSGAEAAPDLDPDSAFAEAFRHRGMTTAYKITAIGELVTLPLVVLVSFMAQPRLLFAMAKDGLLPKIFAEVDSRGTLLKGSLVSGAVCMLTALLIPFECLNTIISAGVLLAFNFVTSSQLVLRHRACQATASFIAHSDDSNSGGSNSSSINRISPKHPGDEERHGRDGISRVLIANLTACASAGVTLAAGNSGEGTRGAVLTVVAAVLGGATCFVLSKLKSHSAGDISGGNYLAPFSPWPQAVALWVNWFLVCQLPPGGLLALLTYVAFAATHYAAYGASRSVGNCTGWSLLLGSAPSSRSPDGSECLTLSADALENAFMVGNTATECSSPTAGQPLLMARDGSRGEELTARPGGEADVGGNRGGGGPAASSQPHVVPITNLQQPTPAAKPSHDDQHMLFRRRALDTHSFRSPT